MTKRVFVSRYDDGEGLGSLLNELSRALGVGMNGIDDKCYVEISLSSRFEPHGRASETWEPVWTLRLVGMQAHWQTNAGEWVPCTTERDAEFSGMNLSACVQRALSFVRGLKISREEYERKVAAHEYGGTAR